MNFQYENVIFREAAKSEIDLVVSLFNLATINLSDNKTVYLAVLLDKNKSCHVELVIGFLEISFVLEQCDIVNFEIKEEFRAKGIGTRFLKYAIFDIKSKGIKEIFLEVRKSNLAAIKLYKKMGFDEIDVRKDYYKNPTEDAIIMKGKI